jgi:hypothetical protein
MSGLKSKVVQQTGHIQHSPRKCPNDDSFTLEWHLQVRHDVDGIGDQCDFYNRIYRGNDSPACEKVGASRDVICPWMSRATANSLHKYRDYDPDCRSCHCGPDDAHVSAAWSEAQEKKRDATFREEEYNEVQKVSNEAKL